LRFEALAVDAVNSDLAASAAHQENKKPRFPTTVAFLFVAVTS